MRVIFLLLILAFTSCAQTSTAPQTSLLTKKQTDRELAGFVGNVKKVFVEWSPVSGSYLPAGSKCPQLTDVYDESGRLTQHSVYSGRCGSNEIREDYTYSQDGSCTSKSTDNDSRKVTFKFDSSGKRTEESWFASGSPINKYVYRYDEKGRMTEMADYDTDGKVTVRRVYDFSGDERLPSGFTYYNRSGKIDERTVYSDYEFNAQGDWIKRKETTDEGGRKSVSLTFRTIEYFPDKK